MKCKSFLIAALVIFGFSVFTLRVPAQVEKKQPKLLTKADYDKREVKRFVAAFIKALDETKDLSEMPKDFFVKDFKTHQTQANGYFPEFGEAFEQLGIDEKFEYQIAFSNFLYLTIWSGNHKIALDEDNDADQEDADNDEDFTKLLPSDVVEVLKKNPLLAKTFELTVNDQDENKPIEASDIIEATRTIREANRLLKIGLENREPSWKTIRAENIKKARKQFADYGTEVCEDTGCLGLPEKTPTFWQTAFPFCLHLVRENGKLKVFGIHIYTND